MSLINWKPRRTWMEFPRWMDSFFDDGQLVEGRSQFAAPAVNISEDDTAYSLEVAAPGVDKKDLQIHIDKGALTVEAEVRKSEEEKEDNYTRQEFSYRAFKRSFWLPENIQTEAIEAELVNGLLKVRLPKKTANAVVDKKQVTVR